MGSAEPPGTLRLRTHGLWLEIRPAHFDHEGWMRCPVRLRVPGFEGTLHCFLYQPGVLAFRQALARLSESVGTPGEAEWSNLDPGVYLKITTDALGRAKGEYEFTDDPGGARLTGSFELDQSFLGPLIEQLGAMLSAGGASPAKGSAST